MKTLYKLACIAIIVSAGAFFTSCKDSGVLDDSEKVSQIASVIKSGTAISVGTLTARDPETKKYFKSAVVGLRAATGGDDLTPEAIVSSINEYVNITDSAYSGVIEGGLGLALAAYKTFYQANIEKEIDGYLIILLSAIADGIESGIGGNAPATQGGAAIDNPILNLTVEDFTL
jgi:hypothetical protein